MFNYDAKGQCESISHQNRKVVAKDGEMLFRQEILASNT